MRARAPSVTRGKTRPLSIETRAVVTAVAEAADPAPQLVAAGAEVPARWLQAKAAEAALAAEVGAVVQARAARARAAQVQEAA